MARILSKSRDRTLEAACNTFPAPAAGQVDLAHLTCRAGWMMEDSAGWDSPKKERRRPLSPVRPVWFALSPSQTGHIYMDSATWLDRRQAIEAIKHNALHDGNIKEFILTQVWHCA